MPLPSFRTMTRDERRDHLEVVCRMLAMLRSRRAGAALDEQHRFADRHWRSFRRMAIDFIAVAEVERETTATAAWN
jgi:hypothetical protein